jgi:hypothetical protein
MPTTPVHRLQNPLRKLRVALGEFGQPLAQEEFAKRVGLSLATVVGIENSRRPLSEGCLMLIRASLWATWNETDKEWYPLWRKDRPYSKEDAQAVAELYPQDPYIQNLMVHCLMERLLAICEAIRPEHLVGRVMLLSQILKEHAKDIDLDLTGTEPHWFLATPPIVWGKKLSQKKLFYPKYRAHLKENALPPKQDAGGIFDFRTHRTFNPDEYPLDDWQEVEAMAQERTASTEENRKNNRSLSVDKRRRSEKPARNVIKGQPKIGS